MEMRAEQARAKGRTPRQRHQWVRYSRISPNLRSAVLAAEDGAFFEHEGVDYAELRKAVEDAIENGTEFRGASTLTQQLAKNLYLSPSRDPLRKLRELIIARRMEAALPKARILEIYLNVIEWGDGVWGAEAAARTYFGTSAAGLSRSQAALLAGAIINPRLLSPARPNGRLQRRQRIILGRMGGVEPPAPAPAPPPPLETDLDMPEEFRGEIRSDDLPDAPDPPVLPDVPVPDDESGSEIPVPTQPHTVPIPPPLPLEPAPSDPAL